MTRLKKEKKNWLIRLINRIKKKSYKSEKVSQNNIVEHSILPKSIHDTDF